VRLAKVESGTAGGESAARRVIGTTAQGGCDVSLILVVLLVLILVGLLPTWPYSSGWGYYPSGGAGLVLLILLILLLSGRL
jgi:hypothetical protein